MTTAESVTIRSAVLVGVTGIPVTVTASFNERVMPGRVTIFGLPDATAAETSVRVRSALRAACGLDVDGRVHVLVEGQVPFVARGANTTGLDLAIAYAVGRLLGHPRLSSVVDVRPDTLVVGSLSLGGRVEQVRGLLPMLAGAGLKDVVVPEASYGEASLSLMNVSTLRLLGESFGPCTRRHVQPATGTPTADFSDIVGYANVRRAMEIAAVGGHGLLIVGEPGCGATVLARRMTGILPTMTEAEALDVVSIHSAAGILDQGSAHRPARPFRAPHHTVSETGLVGGGQAARPGEVTLAHNGVLFLDDLQEFRRIGLEYLVDAVVAGRVRIAQREVATTLPARAIVIGRMTPSPCGREPGGGRCACSATSVQSHVRRVTDTSVMKLFQMQVLMTESSRSGAVFMEGGKGEASADVRDRVEKARAFERPLTVSAAAEDRMWHAHGAPAERFPSALTPLMAVAKSIAFLDGADLLGVSHVEEALSFMPLMRGLP